MSSNYTQKVAFNVIVQVAGKLITTIVSVVMLAYLARYLGVGSYGDYTTIFAFLGFFAIIADMGLYTIAVREMSKTPEDSPKILGNIFSLRLILSLAILLAPLVAWFIPVYGIELKLGILLGSLSSFFVLINQMYVSVFQAKLRMDNTVIGDVVSRVILLGLSLLFIYLHYSLISFVLMHVIANFVLLAISLFLSRRFFVFGLKFDGKYIKEIFREALPLGVIIVLGFIYFRIDTVMLSIMKDSDAVGVYGSAYKIVEILATIPAMFMGSVFPLISRYIKDKDPRVASSFQKSFDFSSVMAVPLLIGSLVLAAPIINLVLGPEFTESVTVLRYLIFAVFIIFFGTIMGYFIVAADIQRKLVNIYLLSVLVNVVGNLLLIPAYSYIGASIVTIGTELLVCSLAFVVVHRHLRVTPQLNVFFKSLFSALVMGGVVYLIIGWNIFLVAFVGALTYGAILYATGGINKEMINSLIKHKISL